MGNTLKEHYKDAVFVDQSNRGSNLILNKLKKNQILPSLKIVSYTNELLLNLHNRKLEMSLFYYQKSPNYCDEDAGIGVIGTYPTVSLSHNTYFSRYNF